MKNGVTLVDPRRQIEAQDHLIAPIREEIEMANSVKSSLLLIKSCCAYSQETSASQKQFFCSYHQTPCSSIARTVSRSLQTSLTLHNSGLLSAHCLHASIMLSSKIQQKHSFRSIYFLRSCLSFFSVWFGFFFFPFFFYSYAVNLSDYLSEHKQANNVLLFCF